MDTLELPAGYQLERPSAAIADELLALTGAHDNATLGAPDGGIEQIQEW